MPWLALLFLFAAPFWTAKQPADWTEDQLVQMFTDSPWAQMVSTSGRFTTAPSVQVYLATAAPMVLAEQERERRYARKRPANSPSVQDPMAEEYRVWLTDNRETRIVLAVRMESNAGFFDDAETHRMEEETVMRTGKKKFKMTGHFPPSASDPYLRMAFPREVQPGDKNVRFELYLPGVTEPLRDAEFTVKDLMVNGKLEM